MQHSTLKMLSLMLVVCPLLISTLLCTTVYGFTTSLQTNYKNGRGVSVSPAVIGISRVLVNTDTYTSPSSTALNVWWFGGTESSEINQDGDSCELVAVRIERTSPNSRRIAGDITMPTPLEDVWAILTDYDRLATHVPNLVESRIVSASQRGEQGDGSFRCKLFQKGAQKIVGFEFGASLTMEMTEQILNSAPSEEERKIGFKCVDSFFFSGFDGEWRAREQINADGLIETVLNYVVNVRPKGPVPVAALEWRIREDVPTNLRAIKRAAMEVGLDGVLAYRHQNNLVSRNSAGTITRQNPEMPAVNGQALAETNAIKRATPRRRNGVTKETLSTKLSSRSNGTNQKKQNVHDSNNKSEEAHPEQSKQSSLPFKVNWEADETMAAYLRQE